MVRLNKCSNFVECVDFSEWSSCGAVYKFGLTTAYRATSLAILIAEWLVGSPVDTKIYHSIRIKMFVCPMPKILNE